MFPLGISKGNGLLFLACCGFNVDWHEIPQCPRVTYCFKYFFCPQTIFKQQIHTFLADYMPVCLRPKLSSLKSRAHTVVRYNTKRLTLNLVVHSQLSLPVSHRCVHSSCQRNAHVPLLVCWFYAPAFCNKFQESKRRMEKLCMSCRVCAFRNIRQWKLITFCESGITMLKKESVYKMSMFLTSGPTVG